MKKFSIEIKWALLFTAMMLLWMVLERLAGLHDKNIEMHPIVTNFVAIPSILIYVFALREKKKVSYGGSMTFVQGLVSGLIMTAIITALSPLSQWITLEVITPYYFENMINYAVSHGQSTLEEAQAYFNMKNYLITTLIFTPTVGAVTTLVVAGILSLFKKKSA